MRAVVKHLSSTEKKWMPSKPLTTRQSLFVEEYLVDLNGTQAAIRAGYSVKTARSTASENLTKPNIVAALQEAMAERAKKLKVSQERVIEELARIGFSNLKDFVEWGPDGVKLKDCADLGDDQARCVVEVSQTITESSGTTRFKLHDKIAALDKLARHLGLYMNGKDAEKPRDYVPLEERVLLYQREDDEMRAMRQRAIDEAKNVTQLQEGRGIAKTDG